TNGTSQHDSFHWDLQALFLQNSTWVSTFCVPWEKRHESLRHCLAQGKRPEAADRRHMVRVIAEAIREISLNPPFRQCAELAKIIVDKYPESFEDRTEEGERMGHGYYTLSKQLRTRIEFLNRDNTLARLRKPKQLVHALDEDLPGPSKKWAKMDSCGCVNWQPSELPEGENRVSLLEKKRELLTIYSQEGQRGADHRRVSELMTSLQQRRDINATPPPNVRLTERMAFLFVQKFLLQHFCTLTGIDIELRLRESLAATGSRVLKYFKSQLLKWKKEVKTVLQHLQRQMEDVDLGLASILVMIAHFKEKEDALFLLADETSTQADAEAQLPLPSTPRLVMLGESILEAKRWMLSIEGKVVLQLSSDFTSALSVLFGSYYVFNIEYPEEAATSLEFIQRFFVRINPEQSKCGSKVQVSRKTGKMVRRRNESLNRHVVSFIRDFIDYDCVVYN
uniref:Sterile alpha motif domain containing 3 n=1 Tax=Salarias fasciatus TaxID=181472 RepID=A0A672HBJ7_SALFA